MDNIIDKYLDNFIIHSIKVNTQIKLAKRDIKKSSLPSISLDPYLKGDYNIGVSRLFNISDSQNFSQKLNK